MNGLRTPSDLLGVQSVAQLSLFSLSMILCSLVSVEGTQKSKIYTYDQHGHGHLSPSSLRLIKGGLDVKNNLKRTH